MASVSVLVTTPPKLQRNLPAVTQLPYGDTFTTRSTTFPRLLTTLVSLSPTPTIRRETTRRDRSITFTITQWLTTRHGKNGISPIIFPTATTCTKLRLLRLILPKYPFPRIPPPLPCPPPPFTQAIPSRFPTFPFPSANWNSRTSSPFPSTLRSMTRFPLIPTFCSARRPWNPCPKALKKR